jgi:hypothetical protein
LDLQLDLIELMKIDPLTTAAGPEPHARKATGAQVLLLQKRLRSISRNRRETLVKRSEHVDRILSELVLEISRSQALLLGAAEREISTTESAPPLSDGLSVRRFSQEPPKLAHEHHIESLSYESNNYGNVVKVCSTVRKPYSEDVGVLHSQVEFLNQELEATMVLLEQTRRRELETKEQLEVLRSQLLESRHDTVELRIQAAESGRWPPAADNRQVRNDTSVELPQGSTWEEQKRALLQAFELESAAIDLSAMTKSEIESLFAATKQEIADRDLQIEELKAMLDMQSQVRADGFAMGASAVNQLLDMEPLIQEERVRLKDLQDELQQKLRDAEIEISVERARIARDRLSLQNASQSFAEESMAAEATNAAALESQQSNSSPSTDRKLVPGSIPRTRRWLQRLGLRDDE